VCKIARFREFVRLRLRLIIRGAVFQSVAKSGFLCTFHQSSSGLSSALRRSLQSHWSSQRAEVAGRSILNQKFTS
jgi:hypothetical protein